jgi:hypothetical protein
MRTLLTLAGGGGEGTTAEVATAAQQLVRAIITKGSPKLQYFGGGSGHARLVCQRCKRVICYVDPVSAQPSDDSGPVILHICAQNVELSTTVMEAAGVIIDGSSSIRRCGLCRKRVSSDQTVHDCNSIHVRHYLLEMTQLGKLLAEDKAQLLHLRHWHGRVVMLYNKADFGADYLPAQLRSLQKGQLPALEVCHLWQCRSQMLVKAGVYQHNMGLLAMHQLVEREAHLTPQMAEAACRPYGVDHIPALATGGVLFAFTGTRLTPAEAAARHEQEEAEATAAAAASSCSSMEADADLLLEVAAIADQAGAVKAAAAADPDYDFPDEPGMPPLSLVTVKGRSGTTAYVVDLSTGGGFGVQINTAHGSHANLAATTCRQVVPAGVSGSSSSSGPSTRSGVTWDEVRIEVQQTVHAGQELLV